MKPESAIERLLFAARWLLAPFYLGMVLALVAILVVFVRELVQELAHLSAMDAQQVIMFALSLINLSLAGNLLLIAVLAGYENFVSKIHIEQHEDRPSWMATVDFSNLKIKVIASIVAISAVALLRAFLSLAEAAQPVDPERVLWMVSIHLTFVISGLLLAAMDWASSKTPAYASRR